MERVFITPYTFNLKESHMAHVEGESLTQPDMALSIRDMLYRFTRGMVDPVSLNYRYDDEGVTIDDDVNPANDMELSYSEIHDLMNRHYSRYQELVEAEKKKREEEHAAMSQANISSDGSAVAPASPA